MKSRDVNRAKPFDSGSSKGRLDIQDKPRFKKRYSNKVPSMFPKASDDRVPKTKTQKGKSVNSLSEKPTCPKCGKVHVG